MRNESHVNFMGKYANNVSIWGKGLKLLLFICFFYNFDASNQLSIFLNYFVNVDVLFYKITKTLVFGLIKKLSYWSTQIQFQLIQNLVLRF